MGVDSMRHRHTGVLLTECKSRDRDNCVFRDELANEHHASFRIALHIEAKIDFFERAMKRNCDSGNTRLFEFKTDQTHISVSVELVELSACGNELPQQGR